MIFLEVKKDENIFQIYYRGDRESEERRVQD